MTLSKQQLNDLRTLLVQINAAIDAGNTSPALQNLTRLNTKHPNNSLILSMLGKANTLMGRHKESIAAYAKSVKLNSKSPDLRFYYARALHQGGQYEEALLECERTIYQQPDHFLALRQKCTILIDLDHTKKAVKAFDQLCESVKKTTIDVSQKLAIAVSKSRLSPKEIDPNDAIKDILQYIDNESCTKNLRAAAYWQIGRLYHHLKEYDHAFDAYTQCKDVKKETWDPDQHTQRIDKLIHCWTNNTETPSSDIDGSRLIFIVGMMRSGTSLTEQMITQIQGVTPGGELNAITRQIASIDRTTMPHSRPYAVTRGLYTKSTINKMAHDAMVIYNHVAQVGSLTDKQPYNYAHVPLIAHMFPGCKIIHCVRNPMDSMLSNFTQSFSRPHMHTHDLYWLGRYYQDYERVMKAWHTIPEVNMIDLEYEKLVTDPEAQSKRVMEFLGHEWTEDILNFHKSKRTISTASRDQVRQPMYTSSVQKHKPYEHRLDELKRGLGLLSI